MHERQINVRPFLRLYDYETHRKHVGLSPYLGYWAVAKTVAVNVSIKVVVLRRGILGAH